MTDHETDDEPDWNPEQLRSAIKAAGVALWTWNVDDSTLLMDAKGYELWEVSRGSPLTFERLSAKIHPADRDRVRSAFVATRVIAGPYEIDFRILRDASDVRWISARGQGNDAGIVARVMSGIFLDVTGRKQAEEGHELLAGEMSHRVKNLLALASGLTAITSRSTTSKEEMVSQLTQRLTALGRAHDLVRPSRAGREMLPFLEICSPFCSHLTTTKAPLRGAFASQFLGWALASRRRRALHSSFMNWPPTPSNTARSRWKTGTLDVSGVLAEGEVEIAWSEQGGPVVEPPASSDGYGSKLLHRAVTGQLDGSICYDWTPSGLVVVLRLKENRLSV
ncbi:HWE histidine kinase domain-containing protein [Rhizobium sp. MJ21]|nr:HWE histidine kinase domain-containing protein [Rhizobium sp. MJ21]